nr:4Fe-4S binding protein [uncultured Desulfobulbus sp.]
MNGGQQKSRPPGGFRRWNMLRRSVLSLAFLLLLLTPLLNYYWGVTFVQGWYQSLGIGALRIISPLEGLESLLVSRQLVFAVLVGMLVPVLLAVILGRVFCSWICPISFLAEFFSGIRKWVAGKRVLRDRLILSKRVLWFALVGELLLSLILGAPVFVFLSPPGLVGREIMSGIYFHRFALEGGIILLVLALELLTRRFFCRYWCPLGALLALMGRQRKLIVFFDTSRCVDCGRCQRACPLGLDPRLEEASGAYCWNCGSCIEACHDQSLSFIWSTSYLNSSKPG